jgi:hypothetical protein
MHFGVCHFFPDRRAGMLIGDRLPALGVSHHADGTAATRVADIFDPAELEATADATANAAGPAIQPVDAIRNGRHRD